MTRQEQLKDFVLKTLLPYKEDTSTCAMNKVGECVYLTKDGKKCAIGKWMKEGPWQQSNVDAWNLFDGYKSIDILKDEAVKMDLNVAQWEALQAYHDGLSFSNHPKYKSAMLERVNRIERLFNIKVPELTVN